MFRRFLVGRGLALAAMKSLWWGNGGTKAPPYVLNVCASRHITRNKVAHITNVQHSYHALLCKAYHEHIVFYITSALPSISRRETSPLGVLRYSAIFIITPLTSTASVASIIMYFLPPMVCVVTRFCLSFLTVIFTSGRVMSSLLVFTTFLGRSSAF